MAIRQFEIDVYKAAADELGALLRTTLTAQRKGRLDDLKVKKFHARVAVTFTALQFVTPPKQALVLVLAELGRVLEDLLKALPLSTESKLAAAATVKQRGERALELLRRLLV